MQQIRERLQRDELTIIAGVGRAMHHNLLQMIGMQGGFHGVWFDHEHVGFTMPELEVGCLAVRSVGLESFTRIAPTDYALVTKCLEAGTGGVMAAQIFTADQARQFVQWSRFYPHGCRGLNTGGYDGKYATTPPAEFCEQANKNSYIAIQIETLSSVDEVDEIAAIEGVDSLFVGPSDLSQALGVTGQFFHEKCLEAIDRVAAACRNHGKSWGAVCVSPEHGEMLVDKGCRLLSPTNELKMFSAGIASTKNVYSKFF
ncbi:HpcH/HpaI aldolase family protein [Thalassoroseus pseudoceratinae]|uniref:HpcH/HpaI aldolase family protein n=1 Tax=Thalassoroseus pseudoceratinae TaxID=2713176 RepID=UPI00141FA1A3|nr:aldolase/citrate lyase family protein [Thalassoroseus pseudoceratinae]